MMENLHRPQLLKNARKSTLKEVRWKSFIGYSSLLKIPPQMNQLSVNDDRMMDILHRSTHLYISQRQNPLKPLYRCLHVENTPSRTHRSEKLT